MKNVTPYERLEEMCCTPEGKNRKHSVVGDFEITKRVNFICNALTSMGVAYEIDQFQDNRAATLDEQFEGLELLYFNIEVTIKANVETDDTLMFIAHHDVNNVTSENCQDNTASIVNVLNLCERIKGRELDKNISFVFTDCEEFGGLGAERLSERINSGVFGNVLCVVNSELTALGRSIWLESKEFAGDYLIEKLGDLEVTEKRTPFNDSVILRKYGIESVCFGILPEAELNAPGYPRTWMLCHSNHDTFDKSNESDMIAYVDFLETLI